MGAFLIFDIEFQTEKDRKNFEDKYEIKKNQILVDEYSNSGGFRAWTISRNIFLEPIYYMGFMGYMDPELILKECLKEKIKIIFLAVLPVNDKNSKWKKIRGRW